MQIAGSFVQGLYNIQLIKFSSDIAIAAMGIINSVAMLIIMTIVAINMAAQPIYGFNYGANNYKRVKDTLIICMKAATGIAIVGWLIVQLFPEMIILAFNNSSDELLKVCWNCRYKLLKIAHKPAHFELLSYSLISSGSLA